MWWEQRNTGSKYPWRVWGALTVSQPHWVCPRSQYLHFSGSKLLCQELSEVGPGFRALPRSKLLRFRFSGTTWLGLHFVPFPGPRSSGDRCLVSAVTSMWAVHLIASPVPVVWFSAGSTTGTPSHVCRASSGELISGCGPPGGCQLSRIPRTLG